MCVGAEDCLIFVYNISTNFFSFKRLKGPQESITHIDYAEDGKSIQANTQYKVHLFELEPGERKENKAKRLLETQWSTWSCPLGWASIGIWSEDSFVNSLDCSVDRRVMATGDDSGRVKLFKYPSVIEGSRFQQFKGHSGSVTNVKFSSDEKYLISLGGHDKSIFQWKYEMNERIKEEEEIVLEEEEAIIDEPSIPPEDDPVKQTPKKRQIEAGILDIQEIKQKEEALATKPYQAEVINSTPSAYKKPKNPVILLYNLKGNYARREPYHMLYSRLQII